ncbi:MAG: ABC-F family ATP-binding cassette domain-containing protein [Myxococcales bacterium]|nr:ABC-F family ATP-binding cassette domain-containing protein [Myxococcales bacterium]
MLHVQGVEKQFGDRILFSGLSWFVAPGERIALVGPNGAGKTTLCRIIAGTVSPEAGEIQKPKSLRIGYLEQEVDPFGKRSVLDEALLAFSDELRLQEEISAIQADLEVAGGENAQELLERLGRKQAELEHRDAYTVEGRARKVLSGLGFRESDFSRPAGEFSGGWMMRIALARLLLQRPDLLILDEPTNHLDLETLQWFETFLGDYEGTLVVISHDRWFINRVANRIAELANGKLTVYVGNYDSYLTQRESRRELLDKQIRQQEKEIAETERFIERFRAKASKASAVQSRVRALDKVERFEREQDVRKMRGFQFPQPERTGRVVAQLEKVEKRYGDLVVYRNLDLVIERGQKIALVGPNGAGKSTLLKILAGVLSYESGSYTLGHHVTRAYFAQHQVEALDGTKTVYEEMASVADYDAVPQIRPILGAFLFSGNAVDKKVSVLSGGEKSRLALAKMLLKPASFLLLDEPTNHLDMNSRELLESALRAHEGSLCFISHDRYFINAVADYVLEVDNGWVTPYLGNYEYYLWKKAQQEIETSTGAGASSSATTNDGSSTSKRDQKRAEAELRNNFYRETKGLKQRLTELEATIHNAEDMQAKLLEEQSSPSFYQNKVRVDVVFADLRKLKADLDKLYAEWEAIGADLEHREAALRIQLEAIGA